MPPETSLQTPQSDGGGGKGQPSMLSERFYEIIQQGIFRTPGNAGSNSPESPTGSVSQWSEDDGERMEDSAALNRSFNPRAPTTTPAEPNNSASPSKKLDDGATWAAHGKELQEKIMAAVHIFVTEKLTAEQASIRRHIMEQVRPEMERVAAEAAQQEVDRFIAETEGETDEEKIMAVLNRIEGLSPESLEILFTRRTMINALRRMLERLELEDDNDWVLFDCL